MRSEKISQVPGYLILAAMDELPMCKPGSTRERTAIDAGFLGKFEVTFKPYKQSRKDLPTCWFWIAEKALRIERGDDQVSSLFASLQQTSPSERHDAIRAGRRP